MLTTKTRQHGTEVHTATTAADFCTVCAKIADEGYAKVNGHLIDGMTAALARNVWEKLNPENKTKAEEFWKKKHDAAETLKPGSGLKYATYAFTGLLWKLAK